MKFIKILIFAILQFVRVKADGDGDDDVGELGYLTILNRFSTMTLDYKDEVFLALKAYFKVNDNIIGKDDKLKYYVHSGKFGESISLVDKDGKNDFERKYLKLNAGEIWKILENEEKKYFKVKVCLVHVNFIELCQSLEGIILNVVNNEYYIPKNLESLAYLKGTKPNLPYSFSNVLNSDFELKAEKYFKVKEKEKEEIKGKRPFDYTINSPKLSLYHQWATLIKQPPVFWQIHYQGKYLLYITQEKNSLNPVLKIFRINKKGSLELLKGVRLDRFCSQTKNIRSEELSGDAMILRCNDDLYYGYLFYKINILDEKIVMFDKESIDKNYDNCSKFFDGEKSSGLIPKIACVDYGTGDRLKDGDREAERIVILDVYDEPLEFSINPISSRFEAKILREKLSGVDPKTTISEFPDVFFCRASNNIHVNINHRVYKRDKNGKKIIKERVKNVIQLVDFRGNYENYKLKIDAQFNDELEFCSSPESLLTFNKKKGFRKIRAHLNYTVYNMRSDFLKDVVIVKTYCMYTESKFVVVYREKPGSNLKIAAFCTRYLYRASSRLFYIQEIQDPKAINVIPVHYKGNLESLVSEKSMAYYYVVPPKEKGKNDYLNSDGNNVDLGLQIYETRRDIDYPRLKMNFENTEPGNYSVEFKVKNSFGMTTKIEVQFQIFPRQNLKVTLNNNSIVGMNSTEKKRNILNLKTRLNLTGNLLNGELKLSKKDDEIKDQVKLVLPVNYLGYFSDFQKGSTYAQIYSKNETIYSITNSFLDITKIDIREKIKQKSLRRNNFETKIDGEIIYLRVETITKKGKEVPVVFAVSKAKNNKLTLFIFEVDANKNCTRPDTIEIENSEQFLTVEKVEIRKFADYDYALLIAVNHNTEIEYHRVQKEGKEDQRIWIKKNRLQKFDEFLLGISNIVFTDFTVNIIGGRPELIILGENEMIFVRICPELGTPLEFYMSNEMFRFCRLTRIECFYQENDGYHNWDDFRQTTECVVATEGIYMHKMKITREVENKGKTNLKKIESKHYKIIDVSCNHYYIFPFNEPPTELVMGSNYFTMSSKNTNFISVYDRNKADFSIGSVWKPYGIGNHLAFTRIDDKDYLIQSSEKSAGKIYGLGYFYLKFLNQGVSLDEATIVFNTKMLVNTPEIEEVVKTIKVGKEMKKVRYEMKAWTCFAARIQIWIGLAVALILVVCCFLRYECKKSRAIKKEMKKVRIYKRRIRELKRKEIVRRIREKQGNFEEEEGEREEYYSLIGDGGIGA